MNVQEIVNNRYGKGIAQCSNEEIYYALLEMTKSMAKEKESNEGKRKLYYISAEFLIGKLLSNNLINLGIYEEVKQVLAENGKNLAEIEEVEPEPSLGNGGLGRLAASGLSSSGRVPVSARRWSLSAYCQPAARRALHGFSPPVLQEKPPFRTVPRLAWS